MAFDPVSAAIVGGGALLGGVLGNSAAKKQAKAQLEAARMQMEIARETNDTNMAIAAANRAQAAEMMMAQLDLAVDQIQAERLGGFDAYGNRTYFHPERGWVTELTPTQQSIQDASERQQILDRTQLDRMQRERYDRTQDLQREDYRDAESQRDAFRNVRQPSEAEIADLLFARGEQGRSEARDDAMTQMLRTQSRQGNTSNIPQIFAEAAGDAGEDAQTAKIDSQIRGMQLSRELPAAERGHRANMYSIFRDRATQPLGAAIQPAAATPNRNFPRTSGSAGALNALNRNLPEQPYIQPDFSPAGVRLAEGNYAAAGDLRKKGLIEDLVNFTRTDQFGDFTDWLRGLGNNSASASFGGTSRVVPHNPHSI